MKPNHSEPSISFHCLGDTILKQFPSTCKCGIKQEEVRGQHTYYKLSEVVFDKTLLVHSLRPQSCFALNTEVNESDLTVLKDNYV